MSGNECKHETRLANLEKESAVMDERIKATGEHVKDINDTVKQMQKWIMGFIISVMLILSGTIIKDVTNGNKVHAKEKEVAVNGK